MLVFGTVRCGGWEVLVFSTVRCGGWEVLVFGTVRELKPVNFLFIFVASLTTAVC